jgi:hypothetical protein
VRWPESDGLLGVAQIMDREPPLPNPDECRANASAARNRAMMAADSELKLTFIKVADEWDVLAAEIERFRNALGDHGS